MTHISVQHVQVSTLMTPNGVWHRGTMGFIKHLLCVTELGILQAFTFSLSVKKKKKKAPRSQTSGSSSRNGQEGC